MKEGNMDTIQDVQPQLLDSNIDQQASYIWNPLKVAALVVLIVGILIEVISLISYSFAGESSNIYGTVTVWVGIMIGILLIFLSAYLLVFSQ